MKSLRNLVLLALAIYLLTGICQIRPEERAVVKRFGRVVARPGPGLWVGLPWGIDRVYRVPTAAVRRVAVGYNPEFVDESNTPSGQFLTGDQNLVNVSVNVDYAVAEGDQSLDYFVTAQDRVDSVISRQAETALAEWIAGQTVDDVLLTGNAALPPWLLRRIQDRIENHHLGVRIQQVSIGYLSPPEEVRPAFEEVNRAQTNIRTLEYRARQEAEQMLREAEGKRFELDQQGRSYAYAKRIQAQAEADAFIQRLGEYQRLLASDPDILTAMWWGEMGKLLLAMQRSGRIKPLDELLGPDGLDITEWEPAGRRP